MDWKLELVAVPVSAVDRAKAFYVEKVGFNADHDQQVNENLRFVQLTPPGSAARSRARCRSRTAGSFRMTASLSIENGFSLSCIKRQTDVSDNKQSVEAKLKKANSLNGACGCQTGLATSSLYPERCVFLYGGHC